MKICNVQRIFNAVLFSSTAPSDRYLVGNSDSSDNLLSFICCWIKHRIVHDIFYDVVVSF